MADSQTRMTGGCQCGAVRYALHVEPKGGSICHCRMCQKAFASPFAAFFSVPKDKFELTRGAIATFATSGKVERGFCVQCGTPLTADFTSSEDINVSIISLDEPARVKPESQVGVESRLPWVLEIAALPEHTTDQLFADYAALYDEIKTTRRQHPDHDTERWPPDQQR